MRTATLLVLSLVMVAAVSPAHSAAFIKFEGLSAPLSSSHAIAGPAAPLEVLSFALSPGRGGGAAASVKLGQPQQSAVITRLADSMTPRLQAGAVAGTHFPHVIITSFRTVNGKQQLYQRTTLTNVTIASVHARNERLPSGGVRHLEDITLLFERSQIQDLTPASGINRDKWAPPAGVKLSPTPDM